MIPANFDYIAAKSLDEALSLLAKYKDDAKILAGGHSLLGTLKDLMGGPHLSSRRWIWEQYDHMVMGDTVGRPGGDAGVVRVHGTKKAIADWCQGDSS